MITLGKCTSCDVLTPGARLLETTNTVLQVALNAGYESEAAFNRAFKREFELPPARYRSQQRAQAR